MGSLSAVAIVKGHRCHHSDQLLRQARICLWCGRAGRYRAGQGREGMVGCGRNVTKHLSMKSSQ